jgi:hypothetical protein
LQGVAVRPLPASVLGAARRDPDLYQNESRGMTLFDYLEAGDSIEEFLDDFPTVRREQVIAFLEKAKEPFCKPAAAR